MAIDVDNPKTWSKYRKGLCDGCWSGCCAMPVEIKGSDLVRLGLTDLIELEDSPKRVADRLRKEGVIRSYREKTGLFMLERINGRDCYFLDENRRCRVYEKRPDVCRSFPESMGLRPGYCPAIRK